MGRRVKASDVIKREHQLLKKGIPEKKVHKILKKEFDTKNNSFLIPNLDFPGIEGGLGLPPTKAFDQRRKASSKIKVFEKFDIGGELL